MAKNDLIYYFINFLSFFILNSKKREQFKYKNINKFMSSIVKDCGKNNKLIIIDDDENIINSKYIPNLKISFFGDNNTIKINKSTVLKKYTNINCSNNNLVEIKTNKYVTIEFGFQMSSGCQLKIGKNTTIEHAVFVLWDEPDLKIEIGDDCMFSNNIIFRPSDGHAVFSEKNHQILNHPADIKINDHVWIGHSCTILKGSNVPKDSIVGCNSVFTKSSNPKLNNASGCAFAGTPAKLIKTGINWDRRNTYYFSQENVLSSNPPPRQMIKLVA